MDSNNMVNSMAAGLGHTNMANSLASSLTNTNSLASAFTNSSMASAFTNTSMSSVLGNTNNMGGSASGFSNANMGSSGLINSNNMSSAFGQKLMGEIPWNLQFGLGRKSASELSPGSRKVTSGLPNPTLSGQQQSGIGQPQGQQAFNIQPPKNRKSGGFFGEEEDNETSMYFPGSSSMFRTDKDQMLGHSQSPSQMSGFGNNFYAQGGLNSFNAQQRGPVSGPQFQRNNTLTPTSMNPPFTPGTGIPQNSPNRGVISAIGQHRMMNTTQTSQAQLSNIQKRPGASMLTNTSATPFSNLASANLASSLGLPSRSVGGQPSFDPSDFPSLGNRVTPSSSLSASRNYVGMVSKNPVQDQTPEFQIQQEDFPALPGAQSTLSIFVSDPTSSGNSDQSKKQPMNLISGSSYEQALNKDGKFVGDNKLGTGVQRRGITVHPDGRVSNIPQGMVADQFGMVGLLTFIKSAETDASLMALAPGMDLTTLGLNLNSPDNLYSTFQSPWVDLACRPQDIDFHVPAEYLTNIYVRDKLAPVKLNRYGEDLLFFLFYMNGGDVLQLAVATELYNRDWRYHKEERIWITRAPGVEPTFKTNTYERGTYYYFDAQNWRKVAKEFHLEYDKLEERPLLPPTMHHNPNQPIAAH